MPTKSRTPPRLRICPLLAMGLALGACVPEPSLVRTEVPPQPEARLSIMTHEVLFGPGSSEPSDGERALLRSFLASLPAGAGYDVRITGEAGGRDDGAFAAAGDAGLALRRARAVASEVASAGLEAARVTVGQGERTGGRTARLSVRTASVGVPLCPQPDGFTATGGRADWGLGCASATNLAAMVAYPADIAAPATLGPADGGREADAVVRYRTDKVKTLIEDRLQP